jgi:hypothetical protein
MTKNTGHNHDMSDSALNEGSEGCEADLLSRRVVLDKTRLSRGT